MCSPFCTQPMPLMRPGSKGLKFSSVVSNLQVSLQKGYNVILKDGFETGLAKGYDYVNKG